MWSDSSVLRAHQTAKDHGREGGRKGGASSRLEDRLLHDSRVSRDEESGVNGKC